LRCRALVLGAAGGGPLARAVWGRRRHCRAAFAIFHGPCAMARELPERPPNTPWPMGSVFRRGRPACLHLCGIALRQPLVAPLAGRRAIDARTVAARRSPRLGCLTFLAVSPGEAWHEHVRARAGVAAAALLVSAASGAKRTIVAARLRRDFYGRRPGIRWTDLQDIILWIAHGCGWRARLRGHRRGRWPRAGVFPAGSVGRAGSRAGPSGVVLGPGRVADCRNDPPFLGLPPGRRILRIGTRSPLP